eukprot:UN02320
MNKKYDKQLKINSEYITSLKIMLDQSHQMRRFYSEREKIRSKKSEPCKQKRIYR